MKTFDALTRWLLESEGWSSQEFEENKNLLLNDIFGKFMTQNALLREVLASLKPSGMVNPPVFEALERFDDELHGNTQYGCVAGNCDIGFFRFYSPARSRNPRTFCGRPNRAFRDRLGAALWLYKFFERLRQCRSVGDFYAGPGPAAAKRV